MQSSFDSSKDGQDVIAVPAGLALCATLRKEEKFTLFSNCNGSLLRRPPGACATLRQSECADNDKLYRQKRQLAEAVQDLAVMPCVCKAQETSDSLAHWWLV